MVDEPRAAEGAQGVGDPVAVELRGESKSRGANVLQLAPHSSTLAWKIPWMEEPGRLQSMGSLRVGHD